MYLEDYLWFFIALGVCALISAYATIKVRTTYAKYEKIFTRSNYTGYDTATRLLYSNDIYNVTVNRVSGHLTDHYHPTKKQLNLSESTFGSNSVAAVAVSAHEVGHVLQEKKGYFFYKVRKTIVPIVNLGSRLAMPLVLVGIIIDLLALTANENAGFYVAMVGVVLYGLSFLFTLITLPVEIDASKRARKMLLNQGILTQDEIKGANAVLSAAAFTYLASMLTSLVYFLRFLLYVLSIFGRRSRR